MHDRAWLDLLVGPDADVGIDRGARAEHHLAADDAALLEEASVLDRHGAADDRPPQPRVQADVGVVPQYRLRDLPARIYGRIAPDPTRSVDPCAGPHLRARADQSGAVDA